MACGGWFGSSGAFPVGSVRGAKTSGSYAQSYPQMHRITQMNIVPDLVGSINPSIALSVTFAREDGRVVPGSFMLPSQVSSPALRSSL
jgi:hypothetical protein